MAAKTCLAKKGFAFNKGFTLLELLIAISLMGIMTGVLLAVINARGIPQKTRDSQRIADIAKMRTALELYFSDHRSYPTTSNWVAIASLTGLSPDYINALPTDPKATGAVCSSNEWRGYGYRSNGAAYVLATNMELASSASVLCPIAGWCDCGFPASGIKYFVSAE